MFVLSSPASGCRLNEVAQNLKQWSETSHARSEIDWIYAFNRRCALQIEMIATLHYVGRMAHAACTEADIAGTFEALVDTRDVLTKRFHSWTEFEHRSI